MPERWQHELEKLRTVGAPSTLRTRIEAGPTEDGVPPVPGRRQRIIAGVVAFALFGGAGALAWGTFGHRTSPSGVTAGGRDAVTLRLRGGDHPSSQLRYGDQTADPQTGSYCWASSGAQMCADTALHPFRAGSFIRVPVGTALTVDADTERVTLGLAQGDDPASFLRRTRLVRPAGDAFDQTGRWLLVVDVSWEQGGVQFFFPIVVTGPANPPISASMVEVPDLIGLGDQGALESLFDRGLHPLVAYREVGSVENWHVATQEPAAGSLVDPKTEVRLVIATPRITPLPAGAEDGLTCPASDRVAFGGPRTVILPAGEAFVRGNTGGIERSDQVVQASAGSDLWHVVRDGAVIAVVDYRTLDGVACAGSGVGGA